MKSPIKPSLKTELLPLSLIVVSLMASFYFYAKFPEQVATHWNIHGEPDDYSSRGFAAFFFPIFAIGLYAMFLIFPYLDPKKEKYQDFAKVYHLFKTLIVAFMVLIYFSIGLTGIGYNMSISTIIPVAVGILFVAIGNYMSKIRPNWFMGIRTPWTLSSDEVWHKTHRLGGKLFILAGLIMIAGTILPAELFWISFIVTVTIAAVVPIIYSLIIYKQAEKK